MFMLSAYLAPVLRWRQGPVMSGFLTFMARYRDEAACIAALAELRWPNGFICVGCAGRSIAARILSDNHLTPMAALSGAAPLALARLGVGAAPAARYPDS